MVSYLSGTILEFQGQNWLFSQDGTSLWSCIWGSMWKFLPSLVGSCRLIGGNRLWQNYKENMVKINLTEEVVVWAGLFWSRFVLVGFFSIQRKNVFCGIWVFWSRGKGGLSSFVRSLCLRFMVVCGSYNFYAGSWSWFWAVLEALPHLRLGFWVFDVWGFLSVLNVFEVIKGVWVPCFICMY